MNNQSTEYFDILTSEGKLSGKIASRDFIHQTGLWHRSVHTWILDKKSNKILLQKRALDKESYPGLLDVASSGHIDAGEKIIDGALRELEEEVGIDLSQNDLDFVFEQKLKTRDLENNFISNEFNSVFISTGDFNRDIKYDKSVIDSVIWVNFDELDELFENHRDQLSISLFEWEMVKEYLSRT